MLACAHCGVHLPQADARLDAAGRPLLQRRAPPAGPRADRRHHARGQPQRIRTPPERPTPQRPSTTGWPAGATTCCWATATLGDSGSPESFFDPGWLGRRRRASRQPLRAAPGAPHRAGPGKARSSACIEPMPRRAPPLASAWWPCKAWAAWLAPALRNGWPWCRCCMRCRPSPCGCYRALVAWAVRRTEPAGAGSSGCRPSGWTCWPFRCCTCWRLAALSNYAALLVLPVLMAGVLTARLFCIGHHRGRGDDAAARGLAKTPMGPEAPALMLQSGLAGLGLFMITLMAGELAGRLAREEQAARGSLELARQQAQLNRLVIQEMGRWGAGGRPPIQSAGRQSGRPVPCS
jgi:hypothetical protein